MWLRLNLAKLLGEVKAWWPERPTAVSARWPIHHDFLSKGFTGDQLPPQQVIHPWLFNTRGFDFTTVIPDLPLSCPQRADWLAANPGRPGYFSPQRRNSRGRLITRTKRPSGTKIFISCAWKDDQPFVERLFDDFRRLGYHKNCHFYHNC